MVDERDKRLLRRCLELARVASSSGNRPFGALLATEDRGILAEATNSEVVDSDATAHPELKLVRWISGNREVVKERGPIALYASTEPCPMCTTGHAYVNTPRIIFAQSGEQYAALAGIPGWSVSGKALVGARGIDMKFCGPVPELESECIALHTT